MAEDMLSTRSEYGRTFITSMWVLGTLVAAQAIAVGLAIVKKEPVSSNPPSAIATTPPVSPEAQETTSQSGPAITGNGNNSPAGTPGNSGNTIVAANTPPVPPVSPTLEPEPIPPLAPELTTRPVVPAPNTEVVPGPAFGPPGMGTSATSPQPLGAALANAALDEHPAHKIENTLVRIQVETGEDLRGRGNMPGALKALREADAKIPDHPRILAELAGTYSQMGLEEKALKYWERVYALGQNGAGGYYALADMALRGNVTSAAGTTAAVLKIEGVETKKSPGDETTGEKVELTVEVSGDSTVRPSGAEMVMNVYFFDKVDGKTIEQSTADTSQDFPTTPYDWQGGSTEKISVIYHQPIFTIEQKRELGKREYHGYVIELYYRDQLQDTRAEPEELMKIHNEPAENGGEVPGEQRGPDGSLFPSGTGN